MGVRPRARAAQEGARIRAAGNRRRRAHDQRIRTARTGRCGAAGASTGSGDRAASTRSTGERHADDGRQGAADGRGNGGRGHDDARTAAGGVADRGAERRRRDLLPAARPGAGGGADRGRDGGDGRAPVGGRPVGLGGPALAAVFGAAALYAVLGPGRHAAHRTHHAVCSAAMAYMAVAMSGMAAGDGHGGHGGHGSTGVPLLTGALLVYFAAYVVRAGVRLVMVPAVAAGAPGGVRPPLRRSPEVADACRISMALGMLAMLVTL
ncbi:DUF5134 domain-containing protein [Actinacidiphila sp. DG2A-62]|uniref:DUF5134 domain-containing protein n=1 Tax=Actinacidiphila sp. DG2A-62 TaxID=3108821 RepID=UPI002DBB4B09|nr:DUF5134 domain-containing protein [Actinacidiphila sp. DG2A-62]MEC3998394.1 DUF5134 domain-containing protein [Actinacidiphila sp. DG2A-62]